MQNFDNINELLDRYGEVIGRNSNYAIAKKLGVSHQAVARWRNGRTGMDETTVMQIAEELNADPIAVLARVKLSRNPSDRDQRVWSRYAGRVLVALVSATAAFALTQFEFDKTDVMRTVASNGNDSIYIMRSFFNAGG